MKIKDFMEQVYKWTDDTEGRYNRTCDKLRWGDPEREVTKVATAMFGTPDVIREAAAWGANLLIVHEPVFQLHDDDLDKLDRISQTHRDLIHAKQKLIDDCGMTIYRYHDHPHHCVPDMISEGEVKYWGLKGTWKKGNKFAINNFVLETPMTAEELAETLEKNLNICHIRIAGDRKVMCRNLALGFGAIGAYEDQLDDNDAVLTGETIEWAYGEIIREYIQLTGKKKALLFMSHIGAERDGMRLLAEKLKDVHPGVEFKYFECGELFTR